MSSDDTRELFDHLDEVKTGKDPEYWEDLSRAERKNWSSFMIRRFLSMRKDYVPILNELQPLTQHMEDRHVYRLYAEIIPHDDGFYKYISSSKKKRKVPDWAIDILKEEFRGSEKEVRTYVDILLDRKGGKEELVGIFERYGVEEDKLKKIRQLG